MQMDAHAALVSILERMIDHCQEMHQLLKNDKSHFEKDELSAIEKSNEMKMAVLGKLSDLVHEISTRYPEGLVKTIKQHISGPHQTEIHALLDELNNEIQGCYKYMAMNNQVLYSNLSMLKEIWDKLIEIKAEQDTYDQKGRMVSSSGP